MVCSGYCGSHLRIPTKPPMHSKMKTPGCTDWKPPSVPKRSGHGSDSKPHTWTWLVGGECEVLLLGSEGQVLSCIVVKGSRWGADANHGGAKRVRSRAPPWRFNDLWKRTAYCP